MSRGDLAAGCDVGSYLHQEAMVVFTGDADVC